MNDPLHLQNRLGFLITRTSWAIRGHMQRCIRSAGYELSSEQWILLNWLHANGRAEQAELAQALCKDKASITRLLEALRSKGLVRKIRSEEDRRRQAVELAERGQELLHILLPKVLKEYEELAAQLDPEEENALKGALNKLFDYLEKKKE